MYRMVSAMLARQGQTEETRSVVGHDRLLVQN
jgi:hypothetical protein